MEQLLIKSAGFLLLIVLGFAGKRLVCFDWRTDLY